MAFLKSNIFNLDYVIETIIFLGFMLSVPILYPVNFYLGYKRHKMATPWSPEEKVVVITGASSGIGESMAYEFARQGAKLVLCARRVEKLMNVAKECQDKHGATSVMILKVDVTNESDIMRLVDTVEASHDKIDCLVLNAGVSMGEKFEALEDFNVVRKLMDVNYFGSAEIAYNSLPLLRKADKPRIIVVSSMIGIIPVPLRTGYAGSKFALRGFFESLQNELIDDKIFITIAYPGVVKTEINQSRLGKNPEAIDFIDSMSADECAKVIVDGAAKGQKEIVFTFNGKLGRLMEGVFPDLLAFLSHKRAKNFLVDKNKEPIDKSL